ncbi:MAG: AsmA family protein [Candidatus Omnitrophota bacterium]
MKTLKFILISVFALLSVLIIAAIIFVASFDLEKYKPRIIAEIRKNIDRELSIERLKLFISPSLKAGLQAQGIVIQDSQEFSKDAFCKIGAINVGIDLMPLILKKEIHIAKTSVIKPQFNLIIDEAGKINIPLPETKEEEMDKKPAAQLPAVFFISGIDIKGGRLSFTQKNTIPPLFVEISELDFRTEDISLASPIEFSGRVNIFAKEQNLDFSGRVRLDLTGQAVTLENVKINTYLDKLEISKLKQALPQLEILSSGDKISGRLGINIPALTFAEGKIGGLTGDLRLEKGGFLYHQYNKNPVEDINLKANINDDKLVIETLSLRFAAGEINLTGEVTGIYTLPVFNLTANAKNIDVGRLIPQDNLPTKFEGIVRMNMQVNGQGKLPEEILAGLAGAGDLYFNDAKLVNLNVLRTVLDKISILPGLVNVLTANLPQHYNDILMQKDTYFKKIEMTAKIKEKRINIINSAIESEIFSATAKGVLDFSLNLDLKADLYIPADLSESMISSEGNLGFLKVDDGGILVPFSAKGTVPEIKVMPDIEYLTKKLAISKGQELIGGFLDKAFKKEISSDTETPKKEELQKQSPEKEIIKGVLEGIFGR